MSGAAPPVVVAPPRWVEALALASVLALAAWLRVEGLARGYTSDELANVMVGSAWEVATDVEAGVNPPLLRVMLNAPFDDVGAPWWGRRFSMACSLAAVALAWAVGRRAGRWWGAGLLAALLLAVHPLAVKYASIFRIYAWWSATALLHVWALGHALDRPAHRGWRAAAVLSAMLLPWIHYLSVPLLLGLGLSLALGMPDRRRWVFAYAPAAVAISPMVPFVLNAPARRVAPGEPLRVVMQKVLSMGLLPPRELTNVAARAWKAVSSDPFHWPSVMTWSLLAAIVLAVATWRGAPRTQRVLTGGVVSLAAGVWGVGQIQWVRDPTMLMMATFLGPMVAGLVGRVRWRWLRWGVAALVAWWLGAQLPAALREQAAREVERDAPVAFAAELARWRAEAAGRPILVDPSYLVPTLYFYLAEEHFGRAAWSRACQGLGPCFEWEGQVIGSIVEVTDGAGLDALVVSFDPYVSDVLGAACARVREADGLRVWSCRTADADLP